MGTYSNIVNLCYTNNGTNTVLKSNLSPNDLFSLSNSVIGMLSDVNGVLKDLDTQTDTAAGQDSLYKLAFAALQLQLPFEHQTYGSMYKLFNYVAAERAMALYLKKEYVSYAWSQLGNPSITLSNYLTANFLQDANGYPGLNREVANINADVANNPIIYKMATLLTNSVATNGTQRLAYLYGLITTNYPFPNGPQPAYEVLCNKNQCTYLIPQTPCTFPYTVTYGIPYLNFAMNSSDGRFQLEPDVTGPVPTLVDLLTLGLAPQRNPLNYLTSAGGLTSIPSTVNGILVARTDSLQTVAQGNNQALYLLDAEGFNAGGNTAGQYLQINGKNVSLDNVVNGTAYTFAGGVAKTCADATFLSVYYDTHISTLSISTNAAGVYHPTASLAMGPLLSLSTGDVLDLSALSGTVNTSIRIYGSATILGGGPNNALSGITIQTYGGTLTVSNLFLSSPTNIIYNISGPLTLVVQGSNSLQSPLDVPDYYGAPTFASVIGCQEYYGGDITFTGPGSLVVTTSSTTLPAVGTAGDIIVNGASNLTFSSRSATSVQAGPLRAYAAYSALIIVNSKVTSRVGVESDNEFAASPVTLGNSVLDMSYGTINPNIISPCTWLRRIRGKSQFTVQQSDSGIGIFQDGIYVQLVGTTGTSEFINLNSLPNNYLRYNGTATFNMSYSITNTGPGDFQGLGKLLSIQIYKQNDIWFTWTSDWADITPNVSGDVASTYHVAGNPTTFGSGTTSFAAVEDNNPYNYTVNHDNTVTLNVYYGSGGAVTVPATVHDQTVTSIETAGFENNTALTSVIIPGSVTTLGASAFYHCYNLTAVYFQGNAPTLMPSPNGSGYNNFAGDTNAIVYYMPGTTGWGTTFGGLPTALWVPFRYYTNSDNATVTITAYTGPGGAVIVPNLINGYPVTSIIDESFSACTSLTSVTIPGSVTNFGYSELSSCPSLMGIYFQGNAPSLGQYVFSGDLLATVYYLPTPGATIWGATFGGLPTALWEPFTCTTNSDNATVTLTSYTGPGGTVTIPGTLNGLPVTSIGTNAFTANVFVSALQITNVLIPNTVTNLEEGAFQMCSNLAGVYFQGSPPSLGANVFTGDAMATAYFLPATTGWGAMFGVLRAAPWLTVNGGSDGGDYSNLQQVAITANNPTPANGLMAPLVQWTGTTQYVANVNAANTTVNLPARPVALTAMFAVAPVITVQPASLAAISGGNATFNVTAWGPVPLAYQWYFNNSSISGATAASQTLTGVTTTNAGDYTVVVTNLYGSVTSSVAALTMLLPPSITAQPASQVAAVGGTANLSASTAGTAPFAYQWFKNGGMVLGATNSALTLANAGVTNSGVYYVVVTNAYGLNISQPVSVMVGAPQLLAWGLNNYGQLGEGTTIQRETPVSVATNVVAMSAGSDHSLFVKDDGTLWTMGYNYYGQLGDGTTANRSLAEIVASNVVTVAAGADHSLYLKSDGVLWAMGWNGDGELGDGTTIQRESPVSVASNVVAVAAGQWHSLYLQNDGILWAMGQNNYGQLGDGTLTTRHSAVAVASNVVAVAAGNNHSLYLERDGTLWGMGVNSYGQLGDGTLSSQSNAIFVAANVMAVAAGDADSFFLTGDGTLWAMGYNFNGQLGDGTTSNQLWPESVASNVVAVAAGSDHSLFLKGDGTLWAMGWNGSGDLGDGTVTQRNNPAAVTGMSLANVVSGSTAEHTLAAGVPLAPVITSQPTTQMAIVGTNVTFTVTASGFAPLAYQWYFNGSAITGATATNYSLAGLTTANAGSYTVVVSNAGGSVTSSVAVLVVLKESASVTLGNLSQTYDGTARNVSVVTSPANLTVNITYNGGAAPTGAGSYTVIGTVSDANYVGSETNTFVIAAASASVTLGNLSQTYDGTAKNVSVVTLPANLPVNVTYNGSAYVPVNAGTYTVVATVTDANYWGGATNTLLISPPPILEPIADQVAYVLMPLLVTNCATASRPVSRPLTFGLCAGSPGGVRMKEVSINGSTNRVCTNGVLGWVPTRDQAHSTNTITVWMQDSGSPPVLATNTFTVVVEDYVELSLGRTILFTGQTSSVPVTLMSSVPATLIAAVGLTNVEALLHASEDQLTELALTDWAPELGNAIVQKQAADTWQIQFTAVPGQVLQTTQQLAQLQFLAVSSHSAFVPLRVSDVTAFQMNGQSVWRTLASDGRAVVLGDEPLVEALSKTNGYPNIVIYGAPGTGYDVLFSPVAATGALWQPVWLGTMPSDMRMPVSGLTNSEPTMFFRARTHAN
jgi:alpha-tubulin suppressor-like RCC1 family protein